MQAAFGTLDLGPGDVDLIVSPGSADIPSTEEGS
jgi:hypothetical protein